MALTPETTVTIRPPVTYFNGFELGLSNADIVASLTLSNNPAVQVFMSYTTAKSLATQLDTLVKYLEKATDHHIMISTEVAAALEKAQKESENA